jgi:hypothetical protein
VRALLAVLTLLSGGSHTGGDAHLQLSRSAAAILYRQPSALLRGVAPDGANGVNAEWQHGLGPGMFIEEQRHGEEAILAGVLAHSPRLWRAGLREFDWAFAHQGPDGGFTATQDPFHSTSFLVEAVAHLTLVLDHSPVPLPFGLLAHVRTYRPALLRAARWLAGEPRLSAGLAGDAPYSHRRFLVGAALGLAGLLGSDRRLEAEGRSVLAIGLAAQLPSGEDPELGGGDDSYQARGLVYAEHYLSWLPADPLAGRLRLAIARGIRWELGQVRLSGFVPSAPNTRANGLGSDHNGPKRVVYPMVAQALLGWGLRTGRPHLIALAARVATWGRTHPASVGS